MKPANLVIEIKDGQVVAVTSTDPGIRYSVFNHDTRNQNLNPQGVDMFLIEGDPEQYINSLIAAQPEKPQEHIKTLLCFGDDSVESRFVLPDGEMITVQLPGEAMKGKTLHEKYCLMMAKIDRYRACSQREMDSATS